MPLEKIKRSFLKNKIFFSITVVILLISVLIALFTRWVLISSLTSELKRRGLGIGQSIAESCRGPILTEDIPQLTSLLFDARLGERKLLVVYVYIQDKKDRLLAHTFTHPFPQGLPHANPLPPDQPNAIRLSKMTGRSVYDIAIPVLEGIYRIGTVHLGVDKNHIDQLIGKLRTTFLGFVSTVTIIFFVINHSLARYITRPISQLTRVSNEISRGNFNFSVPLKDSMSGEDEVRQLASSFMKKDGSPVHVNVHATPARYGSVDALIVATTDISEMVEKDSQLIQASKMTTLGEMSAGIAHEVNQPLNAIKMGSEFIAFMAQSGKKIPEAGLVNVAAEISGQVDRPVTIIQRLRDFGRKSDFSKNPVRINDCVRSVLEIIGRQLTLQNIRLDLGLADGIAPVIAHNNRLEQVIFNLLTNARDAIVQRQENGGGDLDHCIRITSGQYNRHVRLTVSDTGVGISETVKDRIFEAFFTTKQMGEGMGLGLSITNEIVEDYGGTIRIGSGIHGGTAFVLTFPAAE